MKHNLFQLLTFLLVVMTTFTISAQNGDDASSSLLEDGNVRVVNVGRELTLKLKEEFKSEKYEFEIISGQDVLWNSGWVNDGTYYYTGKNVGIAEVRVSVADKFETCVIYVVDAKTNLPEVLEINQSIKIDVLSFGLEGIELVKSEWNSRNARVEIDSEGIITGKKQGADYITGNLTVKVQGQECMFRTASFYLEVRESAKLYFSSTIDIINNSSDERSSNILVVTDSSQNVKFSVADEKIAVVDGVYKQPDGTIRVYVKSMGVGVTKLYATLEDGAQATCTLLVIDWMVYCPDKMKAGSDPIEVTYDFDAPEGVILPSNRDPFSIYSSDGSVVERVELGYLREGLKPVSPGTAEVHFTLRFQYDNADYQLTIFKKIEVVENIGGVVLDKSELTLIYGQSNPVQLKAVADSEEIVWKSSDAAVVIVDEKGFVYPEGGGIATITATCQGFSATCDVTVIELSLNHKYVEIDPEEGHTFKLIATLIPESLADKTVTWESENEAVATVEDGVVTAVGEGMTAIMAKSNGAIAYCYVEVTKTPDPITEPTVTLDRGMLNLVMGSEPDATLVATVTADDLSLVGLEWSSENTGIVTVKGDTKVDSNGKANATVTGVGNGKTMVTLTMTYGDVTKVAMCSVSVEASSGIAEVMGSPMVVTVTNGILNISGVEAVVVCSVDGKTVYSGAAASIEGLSAGVYIVRSVGSAVKIMVK